MSILIGQIVIKVHLQKAIFPQVKIYMIMNKSFSSRLGEKLFPYPHV